MPLFPVLDIETLVQEEDKTRINVAGSYASGTTAITVIEVTPSLLGDAVDVTTDGYLDWQYPFTFEIDDSNKYIDFVEAGTAFAAILTEGEYTLTELVAEIQLQMRAVSTLTYVVSLSDLNEITVAAESEFSLLVTTGDNVAVSIVSELGFSEDQSGEQTYTGDAVERITKIISLRVENAELVGEGEEAIPLSRTITREIQVVSELSDRLFSSDDKLRKHEADIMRYVPEGRATFKDVHRRAQTLILAWLDTEGYIDNRGLKLTLARLTDTEEVTEWATMMALRLIFESIKNAKDDVFSEKAKKYQGLEDFYRNRATIKVDLNRDGTADPIIERLDIRSCSVVRR